jgi:hypothetical protein
MAAHSFQNGLPVSDIISHRVSRTSRRSRSPSIDSSRRERDRRRHSRTAPKNLPPIEEIAFAFANAFSPDKVGVVAMDHLLRLLSGMPDIQLGKIT